MAQGTRFEREGAVGTWLARENSPLASAGAWFLLRMCGSAWDHLLARVSSWFLLLARGTTFGHVAMRVRDRFDALMIRQCMGARPVVCFLLGLMLELRLEERNILV